MKNDYPDKRQLKMIETFPLKKHGDYVNLAYFIRDLWHWDDLATITGKKVITLRLATGGWSGNEDIIRALDKNFLFSSLCWQMSKRGGLYLYKIPKF